MSIESGKIKRKKKKPRKNKITFDTELVTKDKAKEIVKRDEHKDVSSPESGFTAVATISIKKNKMRKSEKKDLKKKQIEHDKGKLKAVQSENIADKTENLSSELQDSESEDTPPNENEVEKQISSDVNLKTEESKRSLKRKKHTQLLQEKRLMSELAHQQKCLNYLSLWKHSKEVWKFEKLRQVWLQQNMYDTEKVPDEFFNILVEYFAKAKGHVKQVVIEKALKIIETEEDEEVKVSVVNSVGRTPKEKLLTRARTVIQTLEE